MPRTRSPASAKHGPRRSEPNARAGLYPALAHVSAPAARGVYWERRRTVLCGDASHGPVAQRIAHLTSDQAVGGSSPSGPARNQIRKPSVVGGFLSLCSPVTAPRVNGRGVVLASSSLLHSEALIVRCRPPDPNSGLLSPAWAVPARRARSLALRSTWARRRRASDAALARSNAGKMTAISRPRRRDAGGWRRSVHRRGRRSRWQARRR